MEEESFLLEEQREERDLQYQFNTPRLLRLLFEVVFFLGYEERI
jgi:hypothetical protein